MSTFGLCPFCGKTKPSANGTGSDVACCGEVGHARVIETEHVFPPIPDRSHDWRATFEGYDGGNVDHDTPSREPVGYGPTEQDAIDNLLCFVEDEEDEPVRVRGVKYRSADDAYDAYVQRGLDGVDA